MSKKETKRPKDHTRSKSHSISKAKISKRKLPQGFRFRDKDLGVGMRKLDLLDESGESVGFIHYSLSRDRETLFGDIEKGSIHLSYMEIYREERKKGYSSFLLKEFIKIADREKLDITLSARDRNLANYYENFGFVETDTIDNSVLMRRKWKKR